MYVKGIDSEESHGDCKKNENAKDSSKDFIDRRMILLSVITVVRDDVDGLTRTYNSLCSQSNLSFEWIVQDGSKERLDREKWGGKQLFDMQYRWGNDRSCYDAMNIAARLARGKWLWFLNAGDICYDNNAVEYISERSARIPETCVLSFAYMDEESGRIRKPRKEIQCRGLYSYRTTTSHQATVYAAKVFRELEYDIRYRLVADHDLFWRLQRASLSGSRVGFVCSDKVVASYQTPGLSGKRHILQGIEIGISGVRNKIQWHYILVVLAARFWSLRKKLKAG